MMNQSASNNSSLVCVGQYDRVRMQVRKYCNSTSNNILHFRLQSFLFWTSGIATIATASFGILGNLLSILVLRKKSMASVFNHLLLSLCISDLVFLLSSMFMSPIALQYYSIYPAYIYKISECFCHVSLAASIFLTASLTIERHQVPTESF